MNILILGYSDLAQRKLIPTINSLDIFSSYEIASKSKNVEKSKKLSNVYKNYIKAIKTTTAKQCMYHYQTAFIKKFQDLH